MQIRGGISVNKKFLYIAIAAAAVLLAILVGLLFWEPVTEALPMLDHSGWKERDGIRVYQNEDGDPLTGWQTIDGKTYYFAPENGAMATGFQEIDGNRYHFTAEGLISTGWTEVDGNTYYLNDQGILQTYWQTIEDNTYFLGEDGILRTGWQDIDEKRYYLGTDGVKATGWTEVDGVSYYLDEEGCLYSGWMPDGSCYILSDGTLATGWQTIDDATHYFNADGTPYVGFLDLAEGRRYFAGNGAMLTGWQTVNGSTYYFKEDGFAVVGKQLIDEKTYYFTSTGANIILVNPWNYLPEDYEVELVELENGHKITPECRDALLKMLADCEAAGHKPYLYSSYRTYAHQQRLFNNMIKQEGSETKAARIVARPGTSEHQLGCAVDITDNAFRKLNKDQAKTATQQWLMEHCWDYGFIVRYPVGTTDITGIIYEPWHYRYVGLELAAELKESGITLEEYLDNLTNDGTTCGNPDALPKE